jgi:hypothetical protein
MLQRTIFASSYAPPRVGTVGPLPINAQCTLTVDWTAYVAQTGETISTSAWVVETNTLAGAAITVTNPVLTGAVATVQMLCSAEGNNVVTNTVTMSDGNVEKRQFRVECLETQP